MSNSHSRMVLRPQIRVKTSPKTSFKINPGDGPPPRNPPDAGRVRRRLAACPEIDCVRPWLPPGLLAAAELCAIESRTGADRVLVSQRMISDEQYVRLLATSLGTLFEPLTGMRRANCPARDDELVAAARSGMLWLFAGTRRYLVIAPRHFGARSLVNALRLNPALADGIRLTTSQHLTDFVSRHAAREITRMAVDDLKTARADFSASGMRLHLASLPVFGLGAVAGARFIAPHLVDSLLAVALALIFLGWTALRIVGAVTTALQGWRRASIPEHELPVYSIIVGLYHETAALDGLIRTLRAFDYPPEKLDIIFVLEPDDDDTRHALARLDPGPLFTILIAPAGGPKTKPKALNAALPFARGSHIAIFDAEDRPEPDQLRRALQAFQESDARLACVQARLTIDNSGDNWLTRMFAAEYAGLFDVFLPGIAAWRLPLPLGGSSNHFCASILRKVKAWDPYNVTEDADLGMRLARLGYRTTVISSTTYEEAPARLSSWLKQRTRWFKGWMQTWLVHMRNPLRLWHELGPAGFLTFQLVVGGTVLASLVHGVFVLVFGWQMATGWFSAAPSGILHAFETGLYATTFVAGYLISIFLALIGLARRRMLSCGWALLGMPVYWLLLSLAAWRALFYLIVDPYAWEKTEHGLARTSRRSPHAAQRG